jgi:hypothetical protein
MIFCYSGIGRLDMSPGSSPLLAFQLREFEVFPVALESDGLRGSNSYAV